MVEAAALESGAREAALARVVDLFWERGAEIASYNEIVETSGLSRKSLYRLWPDKDALIRDTLALYHCQLIDYVDGLMARGGRAGLEAFWDDIESSSRRDGWRGCYLYRTASGPLRENPYVVKTYQQYSREFSTRVEKCIVKAQAAGDFAHFIDARTAGLVSFALIGAISTLGGQSGYGEQVGELIDAARSVCGIN
jgi:AcrR family transcriptional regulator